MEINLDREAPNVVSEVYFRELIKQGYLAEVVCQKSAEKRAAVFYGEWIVRVVDATRTFEKVVVTTRSNSAISVRVHKTGYGLISFMQKAGFEQVTIPLLEGGRVVSGLLPEGSQIQPE